MGARTLDYIMLAAGGRFSPLFLPPPEYLIVSWMCYTVERVSGVSLDHTCLVGGKYSKEEKCKCIWSDFAGIWRLLSRRRVDWLLRQALAGRAGGG